MDLYDYLCEQKKKDRFFTDKAFAISLGITNQWLSRLKLGKEQPHFDLAMKIEELTKGEVTALELMKMKREGKWSKTK